MLWSLCLAHGHSLLIVGRHDLHLPYSPSLPPGWLPHVEDASARLRLVTFHQGVGMGIVHLRLSFPHVLPMLPVTTTTFASVLNLLIQLLQKHDT